MLDTERDAAAIHAAVAAGSLTTMPFCGIVRCHTERLMLSRAVRAFAEDRSHLIGNKTTVFT